ncbi:hypothetical protein L1049_020962 [Liquidambar formosana]|uniref:DUF7903 domain-containing protein n=1 Tax=Liquidambar formosana TaxID=63359 RepID=A0AAP0S8Z6_LIQFO
MAYIPPHKRHMKDTERPAPTPDLLVPQFKRNLNLGPSRSNFERRKDKHTMQDGKIIYADQAISRWCAVGLTDDNQFPSSVCLEPISVEFIDRKTAEKPLALVNSQLAKDNNEVRGDLLKSPWVSIAEILLQDLLSSFQNVRKDMDCEELEEVKTSLVAKSGKILFHGSPSVSQETLIKSLVGETSMRKLKRSFYTNVAASYVENILGGVVPKIGIDFKEEKELYHVKLSDMSRPDATISCRCRVSKDRKLELYKIELKPLRHLVIDISCLDKNLDLRLMLSTKRILTALTDNEKDIIDLISSSVLDPDVKGGLRWPLGKESSGDRYSVIGVWHIKAKAYKNSSMRLKVRDADRFDFRTSTGEVSREVTLKMTGILSQLKEQEVEISSLSDMLKDNFKMIWEHFLCGDGFST